MDDKVHKIAKDGFGKEGSSYDQSRPSYTDELVSRVANNLYKGNNRDVQYTVLELGAGTGKFTRGLWPKLDKGSSYLATEPSEDFLKVLIQQTPDVDTRVCTAVHIPLSDNSVQNIICATSFHWFASNDSLEEMTRVLVPGGKLLLVWNSKKWREVEWLTAIENIFKLDYNYNGIPRDIARQWKTVIESFSALRYIEHTFLPGIDMKGDKDFVVDHFASISVIAGLKDEGLIKVARGKIRSVLDKYFREDENIQIPFFSEFYCAEKL